MEKENGSLLLLNFLKKEVIAIQSNTFTIEAISVKLSNCFLILQQDILLTDVYCKIENYILDILDLLNSLKEEISSVKSRTIKINTDNFDIPGSCLQWKNENATINIPASFNSSNAIVIPQNSGFNKNGDDDIKPHNVLDTCRLLNHADSNGEETDEYYEINEKDIKLEKCPTDDNSVCVQNENHIVVTGDELLNCQPSQNNSTPIICQDQTKSVQSNIAKFSLKCICKICGKGFPQKSKLMHHLSEHPENYPFACKACARVFDNEGNMKRHYSCAHNPNLNGKPKSFQCDNCGKCFTRSSHLYRHRFTHMEKNIFKCDICQKHLANDQCLKLHRRTHSGIKQYKCTKCEREFYNRAGLTNHMVTHSEERNFVCEECGKGFFRKTALQMHLSTHSSEKAHECSHCKKRFSNRQNLASHLVYHTGIKRFTCDKCGMSFYKSSNLKSHMNRHAVEKIFQCTKTQCGKWFASKENLKKHLNSYKHTGEKPFKCQMCGNGFIRASSLRRHVKSHVNRPH